MFTFIAENQYKEQIELSNNDNYYIISITGLTPVKATINTDTIGGTDGTRFNSSRLNERNIVITLKYKHDVEKNRIALYKIFRTKQYVNLYFKNGSRNIYIEGYVESFEGDLFEKGQSAQISVLCPQPYFKAIEELLTEFSVVESKLEFPVCLPEEGIPFSMVTNYKEQIIKNEGDAECGAVIELRARGLVIEPTIYNVLTNESFRIRYEMHDGDVIRINTNSGEKGIRLVSEGVTTNIINLVQRGASWFQLRCGSNIFSYECASGSDDLEVAFYINYRYQGV